ncbi:MAG TPA: hypothetical protein VL262_06515 [Vicinamibacterales bacterium]|nr:hypothetical protein [Vicinamibacterales bacterium]
MPRRLASDPVAEHSHRWTQGSLLAAVLLLMLLSAGGGNVRAAFTPDRVWFTPSPGSIDYVDLFQRPEEWPHARQLFSVFKFYQQHTQTPAPAVVGPNSYTALANAGAFRTLVRWGKKIAIEEPAVKEYYCTADASGMNTSIADTLASIGAVERAGGIVSYLAMDEPFASGRAPACGGPALEPTADRVAVYMSGVRAARPSVQIGLIEAYPVSSESEIETMLDLLRTRNAAPVFLHLDIDLNAVRQVHVDVTADMRRLRTACAAAGLKFGVIVWGNNGDADALYALDAGRLVNAIAEAFPTSADLPDQIIVQSWAVSRTGASITPTNLPESAQYTHTNLLWSFYRRLVGETGASAGGARSR